MASDHPPRPIGSSRDRTNDCVFTIVRNAALARLNGNERLNATHPFPSVLIMLDTIDTLEPTIALPGHNDLRNDLQQVLYVAFPLHRMRDHELL